MGENKARAFDRRRFLKTTAAVSLGTAATASMGTAVSGPWMAPAAAAELPPPAPRRRVARDGPGRQEPHG